MDRPSLLRLQVGVAFGAIVTSIWVFLWIRTLLTVGAVLEFIFMISDPVHETTTAGRSRMVTSHPGASFVKVMTTSAATATGSPG